MTIKDAHEWLTDERLERINHDRQRAGEEPVSKEIMARWIASLKGRDISATILRYE